MAERHSHPRVSCDLRRQEMLMTIDPFLAALAAQTRLLEATERDLVRVAGRIADADQPGLEALARLSARSRATAISSIASSRTVGA